MVVLRNGEVIEGRISRDEGVYIVDLPNGRIRIRQANVELVCSSLEEGYRRKRASIQVGNVHDHLELAQWCMRHNLLGPGDGRTGRRHGRRSEESDDRRVAASPENGDGAAAAR